MKGAIRVFARIRPKVPREADQEVAVWRRDAFSLECAAKDKKSGPKEQRVPLVFIRSSRGFIVFSLNFSYVFLKFHSIPLNFP